MPRSAIFSRFLVILLTGFLVAACDPKPGDETRSQTLTEYLSAYNIEKLQNSPETVTYNGIPESIVGVDLNARLDDYTPGGDAKIRSRILAHYEYLKTVDRQPLGEKEQLYLDIALTVAERDAARADGPGYYTTNFLGYAVYPVTQLSGAHIDVQNLLQSQHPMKTVSDANDFLARLKAYQGVLDANSALVRRDAGMGYIMPGFAVDKTIAILEGFMAPRPTDNPLYAVFADKLQNIEGLTDAEISALTSAAEKVLIENVYPAWARMADLFGELRPQAPEDAGLWAQPDGDALYAKMAAANGDTDLSPEEIHQLGLAEVERITAEIDTILIAEGYTEGTPGERLAALALEERFLYPNTDEGKVLLIEDLNAQLDDMKARLPAYFAVIPEADVMVKRIPAFSEDTAPGGYYDGPSLDGSRPGIYWVNLRSTAETPSWQMPTLSYHEALPGHHFEVAQAVTATDRPLFRRLASSNAFSEGWALYAEYLADEMGAYEGDPYGNLGRLQGELFRAVRLVVDTGMHYKRWSREEAIQYMTSVTGNHVDSVTTEIERYAVWPGQALGYKMGMLKILELRRKAEAAMGDDFDIKAFHGVILGEGPMPMKIVEKRVNDWIAESQR